MSIKYKFAIIFITPLILIAVFGFHLLNLNDEILSKRKRVLFSYDQAVLLSDLKLSMQRVTNEIVQIKLLGANDEEYIYHKEKSFMTLKKLVKKTQEEIAFVQGAEEEEEEEEEVLKSIKYLDVEIKDLFEQLEFYIKKENLSDQAVEDMFEQLIEESFETKLIGQIDAIINDEKKELLDIEEEQSLLASQVKNSTLSIFGAMFLFSFVALIFLIQKLVKPVLSLKNAANKISKNEFDFHLNTQSLDEIGQLNSAFNLMGERIRQNLGELKTLLASIVENTDDAIIAKDLKGNILSWNKGAEKLYGYTKDMVKGKHISIIVPDEDKNELGDIFEKINSGKPIENFETRRLHKDGSIIEVSMNVSPIKNDLGEVIGASKIARDITRIHNIQKDLIRSKDEAEKANLAKSEFLSRMSHELRTPMNAILGFTQLLEMNADSKLSDIEKRNLGLVSSAGKHLLELINEVLDLSSIESGNIKLSIDTVDMAPIVDNVISFSKSLAGEKGISLEYQKIPDDCCFIEADPLRFKQVVLNLVSNAIKYNKPNGSVIVSFEIIDNSMRRLGIRDTGHGIPEDKKDKLFKPFERFDVDAELIEGVGIGLTISKQLIELMNGTVGFETKEGEGSYFYIDIPVSVKAPLPIQVEENTGSIQLPLTNNNKKTILYIEDIPANVELVRQILNHRGEINLLSAYTALAGIELAQSVTPDLILMDIHMPGMDGLTAFQKLQTLKETKDIPVIALTADAMDVDIKKALNMGFKEYLTKPIDVPKFLETIDTFIA